MLRLTDLEKTFSSLRGEHVRALDGVSLFVPEGKMFTLLGASGSGKTTTLRSIAGLERPDAGRIEIADVAVFDGSAALYVPTHKRRLGMVFQSYAIWPHMNVFENVAYPLKVQRWSRADIRNAVEATLATMNMEHLAKRPATLLSGGQQQRLALARAVVAKPRLLLLDEPLSNLDAKLRERMRFELKRLQAEIGITTIYVTHDQTEALALSDEIAVMHDGQIVQQGSPTDIYYSPAGEYVADFIGSTNLVPATLVERSQDGGACVVTVAETRTPAVLVDPGAGTDVVLALRPESIGIEHASVGTGGLPGIVESSVFLGESTDFLVRAAGVEVRVRVLGAKPQIDDGADIRLLLPQNGRVFARAALDASGSDTAAGEPSPSLAGAVS